MSLMDIGAAVGQDLVQDLGQQQRIDDVPLDLHFLDKFGGHGGRLNHDGLLSAFVRCLF